MLWTFPLWWRQPKIKINEKTLPQQKRGTWFFLWKWKKGDWKRYNFFCKIWHKSKGLLRVLWWREVGRYKKYFWDLVDPRFFKSFLQRNSHVFITEKNCKVFGRIFLKKTCFLFKNLGKQTHVIFIYFLNFESKVFSSNNYFSYNANYRFAPR